MLLVFSLLRDAAAFGQFSLVYATKFYQQNPSSCGKTSSVFSLKAPLKWQNQLPYDLQIIRKKKGDLLSETPPWEWRDLNPVPSSVAIFLCNFQLSEVKLLPAPSSWLVPCIDTPTPSASCYSPFCSWCFPKQHWWYSCWVEPCVPAKSKWVCGYSGGWQEQIQKGAWQHGCTLFWITVIPFRS